MASQPSSPIAMTPSQRIRLVRSSPVPLCVRCMRRIGVRLKQKGKAKKWTLYCIDCEEWL